MEEKEARHVYRAYNSTYLGDRDQED
jgi:hypothetical protein